MHFCFFINKFRNINPKIFSYLLICLPDIKTSFTMDSSNSGGPGVLKCFLVKTENNTYPKN